MLEQAMLAEQFQALLRGERQALRLYGDLAAKVTDPKAQQQLQRLLRDKQRHVRLAERLLEIVQ